MPITPPVIDDRRYAELVRDTLARVPVHTPEWTHLGESDPGVTLVELFAFLTESLLYRANRVPEASRHRFLRLLGVPLAAVTAAQGVVAFSGSRLASPPPTLPAGTELRAGELAFRTVAALDLLPLESRLFAKVEVRPEDADPSDTEYWRLLYEAAAEPGAELLMYETRELDGRSALAASSTVDGALWLALLAPPGTAAEDLRSVADAIGSRTLSLGLVPQVDDQPRTLPPVGAGYAPGQGMAASASEAASLITYAMPQVVAAAPGQPPQARWLTLAARSADDVLAGPGIVELPLPPAAAIDTWRELDPLEAGVGDFPPALDDSALATRVLSWVRITPSSAAQARFLWAGTNAARVEQRVAVRNETLGIADGQPDQIFKLARGGVVPGSLVIDVAEAGAPSPGSSTATTGTTRRWQPIDDLLAAGPEIQIASRQRAPGQQWLDPRPNEVFIVDAEAGTVRFGDGLRGRRPPAGARLLAHYDISDGAKGNVAVGAINGGAALPPGVKPLNPLPTWGGADAEDASSGEKRVAGFVRHRDRLVTADDFASIARGTPGLAVARVEVLAAWHPDLGHSQPGDAPGVVTLMLVPRHDARDPRAPAPDRAFIDALCRYLDPRRLVTTELVLRGPSYVDLWLSLGITVAGGFAVPDVRDRVQQRLRQVLAPARGLVDEPSEAAATLPGLEQGWPLQRAVNRLELMAEVARVAGVQRVNDLLLAQGSAGVVATELPLEGLQLPRIAGLAVELGSALPLDALRGQAAPAPAAGTTPRRTVPVPIVPRQC